MKLRFAIAALVVLSAVHTSTWAAPGSKEPSSERLKELQRQRVKTLEEQLEGQFERVKIGKDPMIHFIEVVRELGEAELDLAETREQRLKACERMVKRLQEGEDETTILWKAGLQTQQGVAQIKAARIKAEIQLEKLKLTK